MSAKKRPRQDARRRRNSALEEPQSKSRLTGVSLTTDDDVRNWSIFAAAAFMAVGSTRDQRSDADDDHCLAAEVADDLMRELRRRDRRPQR